MHTKTLLTPALGLALTMAAIASRADAPARVTAPHNPATSPVAGAHDDGCDCSDTMADAASVRAAEAPPHTVWLETLDMSKMSTGWGAVHAAQSVDAHPLTMNGTVYPHGIGTHAISQFAVNVGGASRFVAMVGVDDEVAANTGSVAFEVYADGKLVAESGIMHRGDVPRLLSVNLTGVQQMVLFADNADDDINYDHADWGGAMLVYPDGMTPAPEATVVPAVVHGLDDETPMPIAPASVPGPQPRINGARVVGTTPGRPFLFQIPATGQLPLTYSARNIPVGLRLDPATGIISGTLHRAGTSVMQLSVRNSHGTTSRNLVIMGGSHLLSRTPPMGWNSWNIFWCDVDEAKVRQATDAMINTGLARHGYQYINIDDCWQGTRDNAGSLHVNPKFGDLRALGDYIHARGLLFGIYSSPGPQTCAHHEGSFNFTTQDARSYAAWGVDYLKYDWCSYGDVATGGGREKFKLPYRVMRESLDSVNRDIVYSLCQYGMDNVWEWGNDPDVRGNLWRTTGDIGPSYGSMTNIGFSQSSIASHAGPGHWNDPDMLFLHALKPNEQITHLSLWSLQAAPLLIGSDLSKLPRYTLDALSNDEMIAIDQDPLGIAATQRWSTGSLQVWARPLWDGTLAVGLFNRGRNKTPVTAHFADLGLNGAAPVRDVWQQRDLGVFRDGFTGTVPAHGAMLLKIGAPSPADYVPAPEPLVAPVQPAPTRP